jgi:4-hydroxyphenylpyruvate dioxygenase
MGPYPHGAAPATITADNPAGTDGFEFVEFAHPKPAALGSLFATMGFVPVARHRRKDITVWRQGDVNYVVNAEPGSFAARFVEKHGPCAPSMAWRVADAAHAFAHAVGLGAEPYEGADKTIDAPAIVGIGGSLIYFVDTYGEKGSPYAAEFDWTGEADPASRRRRPALYRPPHPQRHARQHGPSGSASMPTCSTSARSASSTSRAGIPACSRGR